MHRVKLKGHHGLRWMIKDSILKGTLVTFEGIDIHLKNYVGMLAWALEYWDD